MLNLLLNRLNNTEIANEENEPETNEFVVSISNLVISCVILYKKSDMGYT